MFKSTRSGGRGTSVKSSGTVTKKLSAKRSGTKASSIKKTGGAMDPSRGLHGGRRKPV